MQSLGHEVLCCCFMFYPSIYRFKATWLTNTSKHSIHSFTHVVVARFIEDVSCILHRWGQLNPFLMFYFWDHVFFCFCLPLGQRLLVQLRQYWLMVRTGKKHTGLGEQALELPVADVNCGYASLLPEVPMFSVLGDTSLRPAVDSWSRKFEHWPCDLVRGCRCGCFQK